MATQLKTVKGDPPDEAPHGGLSAALAKAFGEIEAATKDAVNPAFKQGGKVSKYADLTAVIAAIKPALINHGLFFTQRPQPSEGGVTIETVIGHAGGEEMSLGSLFVPANKNDAQGFGSALTYARRYALVTAFGVPVEDDDGNAAARGQSQGGAVSPSQSRPFIEDKPAKPTNWGGRYPTKTALKQAMHTHHAELERIGIQGTMDDLEGYLSSPEYDDYIRQAAEHAPAYLEGPLPDSAPPEFIQTFTLEQKARDMIALRGNVPADVEG